MANETDESPIERLERSLEELEKEGELDSEQITFRRRRVGGLSPDEISDVLGNVEKDDPVRVTIEPTTVGEDPNAYSVQFDHLELIGDEYLPGDLESQIEGFTENLRETGMLLDKAVQITTHKNMVVFDVETEKVTGGSETIHYCIPSDVQDLINSYDAHIGHIELHPSDPERGRMSWFTVCVEL